MNQNKIKLHNHPKNTEKEAVNKLAFLLSHQSKTSNWFNNQYNK